MNEIRIFDESHIQEVADLELKIFHGRRKPAGADLREYFAEIFLRNPWRDDELSSLVYLHDGKIVGFAGVIPRRMVFRGAPVRVAAVSQLMADRDDYRGMAGFELMRRILAGPQDLTLTDGATQAACAIWTAAGARLAELYSLQWTRVLKPLAYYRDMVERHPRSNRGMSAFLRLAAAACSAGDAVLRKLPLKSLSPPRTGLACEPVNADGVLDCILELGWREELAPCYERESFNWLMKQASAARSHGELRMCVVREPQGPPAGWLIYYVKRGGECVTLQLGAPPNRIDAVIQALLRDVWEQGGVAVGGQWIPRAFLNCANQRCTFKYVGHGVLVHSRNPELLNCIWRGDAALSRLDGEWWARFKVGDWE